MRRLLGLSAVLALFATGPAFGATKDKDKKEDTSDSSSDTSKKKDDKKDADKKDADKDSEDYSDEPTPDAKDFKDEGDDDATPPPKRLDEGDKDEKEGDDLDFKDDEPSENLKFGDESEQDTIKPRGPGEDTAQIYRDTQKKLAQETPDEELIGWENYLKKYPNSLFKDRIDTRTEELSGELFGERVPGSDAGAHREDAANRELNFSSPLQFTSAEPRTRLGGTVEIGIPNWAALHADAEFELLRPLSAHLGVEQDVTGPAVALGAKYAIIKSARTNTVFSAAADFKLGVDPETGVFPMLRPTLLFGQKLSLLGGLYLQAALGVDAELRDPAGLRYFYGFDAELRANDVVYVYAETSGTLKYLGNPDFGSFRFMVASLGMKFVPTKGGMPTVLANKDGAFIMHDKKPVVIVLGANIPYSTNYWGFYQGSVTVGAEWYL